MKGKNIFFSLISFLLIMAALYSVFIYAPTELIMGDIQRIFYFHLASAITTFVAFFVVFLCSILYLWKKNEFYDLLAYSSAEIGVIFCTIVLITGSIWARPIWNTWWTWDPRLTTTLILWLTYVSYLLLRSKSPTRSQRARFCAIFGIVGFVNIPIVFMSIRWWRTIHPKVITSQGIAILPSMVLTLVISLVAVILLYGYLLRERYRLEKAKSDLETIRGQIDYN